MSSGAASCTRRQQQQQHDLMSAVAVRCRRACSCGRGLLSQRAPIRAATAVFRRLDREALFPSPAVVAAVAAVFVGLLLATPAARGCDGCIGRALGVFFHSRRELVACCVTAVKQQFYAQGTGVSTGQQQQQLKHHIHNCAHSCVGCR
jgi:hypothetical protein